MKKEQTENIKKLYEQGLSSREEEEYLLKCLANSKVGPDVWFRYINHHKKQIPENLEDDIWTSIQTNKKKKKTLFVKISAAAASVLLILSFVFLNPLELRKMNEIEKNSALEEAFSLISESEQVSAMREILYEDDILIIYSE